MNKRQGLYTDFCGNWGVKKEGWREISFPFLINLVNRARSFRGKQPRTERETSTTYIPISLWAIFALIASRYLHIYPKKQNLQSISAF